METGYIYLIINLNNGKKYVGQTVNFEKRKKEHFDNRDCSLIDKVINNVGSENFKMEIIEEPKIDELDEREKFWINKLNTFKGEGYNLTIGGENYRGENNPFYGENHTLETKQKLSKIMKDKYKDKDNHGFIGKSHKPETKKKISEGLKDYYKDKENPFKGKKHTEDTKERLRNKMKGRRSVKVDIARKILNDRIRGLTYKELTGKYGYSNSTFWRIIKGKHHSVDICGELGFLVDRIKILEEG